MSKSVFYRFRFQPEHVIVKTETISHVVHFISDGRKGTIKEKIFDKNFVMVTEEEDQAK